MHFATLDTSFPKLGTSLTKFGTSDPIAYGNPIGTRMIHDFSFQSIRKLLGVDPHIGTYFGILGTSFTKFGMSFIKFGTFDPIASGTPI